MKIFLIVAILFVASTAVTLTHDLVSLKPGVSLNARILAQLRAQELSTLNRLRQAHKVGRLTVN
jgi:archaellum component FlaG (FlaF/FlaG flagellin family)